MLIRTLALFVTAAQSFAAVQSAPLPTTTQRWTQAPTKLDRYTVVPGTTDVWQAQPQSPHAQSPNQGAWVGVSLLDNGEGGPTVGQVVGGSPAEHAGLLSGDRIVSIDETRAGSTEDVIKLVSQLHPGTEVSIQVRREISVALVNEHKSEKGAFVLGLQLGSAQKVGDDEGVEVNDALEGWPAKAAGMQDGDVLLTVEGKRVASSAHVSNVLKSIDEPREVSVELARKIRVTLGTQSQNLAPKLALPRQARPVPATPAPVAPVPPATRAPHGVLPRAQTPGADNNAALLDEVRALSRELRELRDQISALRSALAQQPSRK